MTQITVKGYFEKDTVKQKFNEILGEKSENFITSVLQAVNDNNHLSSCDPASIFNAAAMAAILDFPINKNLGEAYILPYGNKAQFQIGYKGFIQLAIRSGQYETIGATPIYDGQIVSNNPLTGFKFDFSVPKKGSPIGYAASFKLLNGFEKTIYMTHGELVEHGKRYSKSYSSGQWAKNFDKMAIKTVIKKLINNYGPKSIMMQKAINADQSVVNNFENNEFSYPDNDNTSNLNQKFDSAVIRDKDGNEII